MERDEILDKILHQSQLTGIIAWISMENFDKKDMIVRKLNSYLCWSEVNWEMYFQENKRNHALQIKTLTQEKELIELRAELSELKKSIENKLNPIL